VEVVVDLDAVVVTFGSIEDLDRVTVRVASPATASPEDAAAVHRLGDVLAATNVGTLEHDPELRAWISPVAAQFHAAGQVGPEWAARLESRCAESEGRGGPRSLEARVVWPGDRS
jgi:hypothetical protein